MTISRTLFPLAFALAMAAAAPSAHAQSTDLSSLHDALHLTAAQEDGWRAYRAAILPDPAAEARRRSASMMIPTLTTPRRIDLISAEMEEDLAAMRRQGQAVKMFYATLTPDQQRAFDHQTLPSTNGGQGNRNAPTHVFPTNRQP